MITSTLGRWASAELAGLGRWPRSAKRRCSREYEGAMARYSGRTTVSPVMGTRTSLDPFITWNDLAHDGASEAGAGSPRRYPTTTRREVLSGSRQGSCHGSDNQVVGEALRCPPHRTGRLPPRSEGRSCRCFHVRLTWRRRRPLLVRR